jgi:hypothetical protein
VAPGPGGGSRGHGARGSSGAAPRPGGGSRGHEARGGSGAPLNQEAGARAAGQAGMRACPVFRLDSKLVHGGTQSSGYRQIIMSADLVYFHQTLLNDITNKVITDINVFCPLR